MILGSWQVANQIVLLKLYAKCYEKVEKIKNNRIISDTIGINCKILNSVTNLTILLVLMFYAALQ